MGGASESGRGLRMCDVSRDTHNKRHILLA